MALRLSEGLGRTAPKPKEPDDIGDSSASARSDRAIRDLIEGDIGVSEDWGMPMRGVCDA